MPIVAVNVVKVLFAIALYGFLFYVARAVRGHIAGPPVAGTATPSPPSSARTPAATPVLEIALPNGTSRHHPLEGPVVLGRGETADLRLDDEYASDRHALFTREGGTVYLEDLGSTNGTTLDGVDAVGRVEVTPGSTVVVGRTRVRLR